METKIVRLGINGEGIGYFQRKPVFIKGALVDETVEFQVVKQFPTYFEGKLLKVTNRSKKRVKPLCKHQGKCDACPFMIQTYDSQVEEKYNNLVQTLQKYANISPKVIQKVVKNPHPLHYRNQCKLPFVMQQGKLVNALYLENSNHTFSIDTCLVHEKELETMRMHILDVLNRYQLKAYDHKTKLGMRYLVLRHLQGQFQCTLVTGNDVLDTKLVEELLQLEGMKSLYQSVQTTKNTPDIFGKKMIHLGGSKFVQFKIQDLTMRLSCQSFFQLNTVQAEKLYGIVKEMVPYNLDSILEVYSGIGGISLLLKDHAKKITGIEYIESAVRNANENAKRNGADHVQFIAGDAAEVATRLLKKQSVDCIVVDPPRSGLDEEMVQTLMNSRAKQIVYVSCNPSTLAKNLAVLTKRYDVVKIVPVDMFSQTQHCESVCLLKQKNRKK